MRRVAKEDPVGQVIPLVDEANIGTADSMAGRVEDFFKHRAVGQGIRIGSVRLEAEQREAFKARLLAVTSPEDLVEVATEFKLKPNELRDELGIETWISGTRDLPELKVFNPRAILSADKYQTITEAMDELIRGFPNQYRVDAAASADFTSLFAPVPPVPTIQFLK